MQKEQQVSKILDSQSDAIVVVKALKFSESVDKEETASLSFQFCNSKSVEMFGIALNAPGFPEQASRTDLNLLTLSRFVPLNQNEASILFNSDSTLCPNINILRSQVL